MDKIQEAQYQNLRKCFEENLITPILGKGYYNMAMDVYACDEETTKDIQYAFYKKNQKIKALKVLIALSAVVNFALLMLKFL